MNSILFSVTLAVLIRTSVASVQCPEECECFYKLYTFLADCSGKNLDEIPPTLDRQIQGLDLSNNLFRDIPPEISSFTFLEMLNMSRNQIEEIDRKALTNLTYLEILDLSKNKISSWDAINPNHILQPAQNLKKLILSKNPIQKFGYLNRNEYLISDSLEILEMEGCGISVIDGSESPIEKLTALKTLKVGFNPLIKIKTSSPTLQNLDLRHCQLTRFSSNSLQNLPSLTHLHLPHNYRLDLSTKSSALTSKSLTYADLSFCNMNGINLANIPNVEVLLLKGNMIRRLTGGEFTNQARLKILDLSSNAIGFIHQSSFIGLQSLRHLNLSTNVISEVHEDTFENTPNLTILNLSRNLISNLKSFKSKSIISLDLSICEIKYIDSEALENMPSILTINLARNFITQMPDGLASKSLQQLDMSFNRLSDINNSTFQNLPSLIILNLSGNRFTSMWKASYFDGNKDLIEMYLDDNTWRCDCYDPEMKGFFLYLTSDPSKIWDLNSLVCHSPSNISGTNWMKACYYIWYPHEVDTSTTKAMNFLLAVLCAFFICFLVLFFIKRSLRLKMVAEQERRRIQMEEARERFREQQMRREQEALRNAPDPRDLVSPPSYDEALLMPRLDGSFHSLSNINGGDAKQKKRLRRRTRSSGDLLEQSNPLVEERRQRRPRDRNKQDRRKRSQSTSNMTSDSEVQNGGEEIAVTAENHLHESDL